MIEADLLPTDPATHPSEPSRAIDARGWCAAIVLLALAGVWSLRTPPVPGIPQRIEVTQAEPWMVDTLPGIGARTRERYWRVVRTGVATALPERARAIARQVFTWPEGPRRNEPPSDR